MMVFLPVLLTTLATTHASQLKQVRYTNGERRPVTSDASRLQASMKKQGFTEAALHPELVREIKRVVQRHGPLVETVRRAGADVDNLVDDLLSVLQFGRVPRSGWRKIISAMHTIWRNRVREGLNWRFHVYFDRQSLKFRTADVEGHGVDNGHTSSSILTGGGNVHVDQQIEDLECQLQWRIRNAWATRFVMSLFRNGVLELTNWWIPFENYNVRPLALMDKRSLDAEDLVADHTGHGVYYPVKPNPRQEWHLYPDVDFANKGEILMFQTCRTPHSSATGTNNGAIPNDGERSLRVSAEIRPLCMIMNPLTFLPKLLWCALTEALSLCRKVKYQ